MKHYGHDIRRHGGEIPKGFVEILALEPAERVGRDNQSTNGLKAIFIRIPRE